jgi:WD40 repeat protein
VWDLATGAPVGDPLRGHAGPVHAVAVAVLEDRPVVISASGDKTIRVWDLATGAPVGDPFRGHARPVHAVAAAELDGRPVVISGSGDGTVRVWELATGNLVGEPFRNALGTVTSVAQLAAAHIGNAWTRTSSVLTVISADDKVIVLEFSPATDPGTWTHVMTIHLESHILATAWLSPETLIVAAESGIVAFSLLAGQRRSAASSVQLAP